MLSSPRIFKCRVNPKQFCYICGKFYALKSLKSFTSELQKAYFEYFRISYEDEGKPWAPPDVCIECRTLFYAWKKDKRNVKIPFTSPMVWREQKEHVTDCYFCLCTFEGIICTSATIKYPEHDLDSAIKPRRYENTASATSVQWEGDALNTSFTSNFSSGTEYSNVNRSCGKITQAFLNDLVRDLDLSKDKSTILARRLAYVDCLANNVHVDFRNRDQDFRRFFIEEDSVSFCNDIFGLMDCFNCRYNPENWRLFIDGSTRSLKFMLLHIGNRY